MMFRILLVEDDEMTLTQLKKLLEEELSPVVVETAENVKDGLELIKASAESGRGYDAAVLDFKLPTQKGETTEVDESLCRAICLSMRDTLVVHITAYKSDPQVIRHMVEWHSNHQDAEARLIAKDHARWPLQLLKTLKAYLYGSIIRSRMEALFGPASPVSGTSVHRRLGQIGSQRCATHELNSLFRDISQYWNDLDSRLQGQIKKVLHVNEKKTPVYVGLIDDISRQGG